jgi:hypothetical protein
VGCRALVGVNNVNGRVNEMLVGFEVGAFPRTQLGPGGADNARKSFFRGMDWWYNYAQEWVDTSYSDGGPNSIGVDTSLRTFLVDARDNPITKVRGHDALEL